MIGNYAIGILR